MDSHTIEGEKKVKADHRYRDRKRKRRQLLQWTPFYDFRKKKRKSGDNRGKEAGDKEGGEEETLLLLYSTSISREGKGEIKMAPGISKRRKRKTRKKTSGLSSALSHLYSRERGMGRLLKAVLVSD